MKRHLEKVAESKSLNKANDCFGQAMLIMIATLFLYWICCAMAEPTRSEEAKPVHLHRPNLCHKGKCKYLTPAQAEQLQNFMAHQQIDLWEKE